VYCDSSRQGDICNVVIYVIYEKQQYQLMRVTSEHYCLKFDVSPACPSPHRFDFVAAPLPVVLFDVLPYGVILVFTQVLLKHGNGIKMK
jgi:hypothetical protein